MVEIGKKYKVTLHTGRYLFIKLLAITDYHYVGYDLNKDKKVYLPLTDTALEEFIPELRK